MAQHHVKARIIQALLTEHKASAIDSRLLCSPVWAYLAADTSDRIVQAGQLVGLANRAFFISQHEYVKVLPDGLQFQVSASGMSSSIIVPWEPLWDTYLPLCLVILQTCCAHKLWDAPVSQDNPQAIATDRTFHAHSPNANSSRVLIGIAGAGGSGKTTLCEILKLLLNCLRQSSQANSQVSGCVVISQDGYHYTNTYLEAHGLRKLKGLPTTFDIPRFVQDLKRVKQGGPDVLWLPSYDRSLHDPVENRVTVPPEADLVIVEGLFLNHFAELRELLDLSIHLSLSKDMARDMIVARGIQSGRKKEDLIAHYSRVDGSNYDLVEQSSIHADLRLCLFISPVNASNCVSSRTLPTMSPSFCCGSTTTSSADASALSPEFRSMLSHTLKVQRGVLFARPAIVYRNVYCGRGILGDNSTPDAAGKDERGYVPVEWWIMSKTHAVNPTPSSQLLKEGITDIVLRSDKGGPVSVGFDVLAPHILGAISPTWPLVKLLDIGGEPRVPRFAEFESISLQTGAEGSIGAASSASSASLSLSSFPEAEVPPIPAHTHAGLVQNNRAVGAGKFEAYFFPEIRSLPVNIAPQKVISRLGIKPQVTREHFLAALRRFGQDDSIYALLNAFEIHENEGWTILPGIVHSPGPWPTLEMQRPQDDFNLLAWHLGLQLSAHELPIQRESLMLRGFSDENVLFEETVRWDLCTARDFMQRYKRVPRLIDHGEWGHRSQIFFDIFYAESLRLQPQQTYIRPRDGLPFSVLVWIGTGSINGNPVSALSSDMRELLVVGDADLQVANLSKVLPMTVYLFFPIKEETPLMG